MIILIAFDENKPLFVPVFGFQNGEFSGENVGKFNILNRMFEVDILIVDALLGNLNC